MKLRAFFPQMLGTTIVLGAFGFVPNSSGDPVVIVGTFWRTNITNSSAQVDKNIQIHGVCQAIKGAQALGHEVVLLTPNVTCDGKVYPGRCPDGGECRPQDVEKELTSLALRMPSGVKQNLFIQTVGHGSPDMSPSWDEERGPQKNELGIGPESLNAKDFAEMLKKSGVVSKSAYIRGLWTQCYSGGWNEISSLISPAGKACSVSQARHNETADVSMTEYERLGGAAFILGFWQSVRSTNGKSSLQESTTLAAHLNKSADRPGNRSYNWTSSSSYLSEKNTGTGSFYRRTSEKDYAREPPKAYFADGYDVEDLSSFRAFKSAAETNRKSAYGIQDRYKSHVEEVRSYNRDKWFWQDERTVKGSYLMRSTTCKPEFENPISEANRGLVEAIDGIRQKMEREDYARIRATVAKKLEYWEKIRVEAEKGLEADIKRYHERMNALLLRSGKLTREIELGNPDYTKRKELEAEYKKLEREFLELDQLDDFPKLRAQLAVEKQVQQLGRLLQLIEDKKIDRATKDRILSTWECENSPIFTNAGGKA